jgi:hypothetical protein
VPFIDTWILQHDPRKKPCGNARKGEVATPKHYKTSDTITMDAQNLKP